MNPTTYTNLDNTKSFAKLRKTQPAVLKQELTAERVAAYSIPILDDLTYNYAAMPVQDEIIETLQELVDEQQAIAKYTKLALGEVMNTGEKRRVLHHLTRGILAADVVADDEKKHVFYAEQLSRIAEFSQKVHSGEITGSTGKKFTTVVQIGIGGSDLGPRALYLALLGNALKDGNTPCMRAEFISNVDPDDAAQVLARIDFEETLFILVTKSGTTQETLTNKDLALQKIAGSGIPGIIPAKHMVAVTSKSSPLATSRDFLTSFFIDDYIGGRYSSTSAVGGLVLSLALGYETFSRLLAGAHAADKAAMVPDIKKNAALMDAAIGVYLRNILAYPSTAVLPYSQALSRFPAHLQQLDMESNGKQVNRNSEPVSYPTGPVIFGEPGTNGQHSFYQHLHQGTDTIPLQFIGFSSSQVGADITIDGSTSQEKLNANLAAQIIAFAKGSASDNLNKNFPGERYSSLIHGKVLSPENLGALLAHYENKVMFQGFLWNLNSFDQEGVQLGKILTKEVLSGKSEDSALAAFYAILS